MSVLNPWMKVVYISEIPLVMNNEQFIRSTCSETQSKDVTCNYMYIKELYLYIRQTKIIVCDVVHNLFFSLDLGWSSLNLSMKTRAEYSGVLKKAEKLRRIQNL
jgi:hypothetical protein